MQRFNGNLRNGSDFVFTYPIVAETFDFLNDANGEQIKRVHAFANSQSAL